MRRRSRFRPVELSHTGWTPSHPSGAGQDEDRVVVTNADVEAAGREWLAVHARGEAPERVADAFDVRRRLGSVQAQQIADTFWATGTQG